MTPAEAVAEKAQHASCGRATKVVLSACTALYSSSHLFLFILSAIAWRQSDHSTKREVECAAEPQLCNPSRGALHAFIMMASLVCFLTTGLMAARLIFHRRSSPADPVWVFRGIFFTLVLLVPLLFVGWTAAQHPKQQHVVINNYSDFLAARSHFSQQEMGYKTSGGNPIVDVNYDGSLPDLDSTDTNFAGGISGAFIIESTIAGFGLVKASIAMFHANIVIGAIVAGLACALAPISQGVSVAC